MNTSNKDPRSHFNKKNLCPRCLTGIDDDHDGNCAFCACLSDSEAANMRRIVLQVTVDMVQQRRSG